MKVSPPRVRAGQGPDDPFCPGRSRLAGTRRLRLVLLWPWPGVISTQAAHRRPTGSRRLTALASGVTRSRGRPAEPRRPPGSSMTPSPAPPGLISRRPGHDGGTTQDLPPRAGDIFRHLSDLRSGTTKAPGSGRTGSRSSAAPSACSIRSCGGSSTRPTRSSCAAPARSTTGPGRNQCPASCWR